MITDQAMPQTTGSELIAHARRQRPGLPIILAAGHGETPSDIGPAVLRRAIEAVDKPRRA